MKTNEFKGSVSFDSEDGAVLCEIKHGSEKVGELKWDADYKRVFILFDVETDVSSMATAYFEDETPAYLCTQTCFESLTYFPLEIEDAGQILTVCCDISVRFGDQGKLLKGDWSYRTTSSEAEVMLKFDELQDETYYASK